MNSHPVLLLKPAFHFLDRMIHEHGNTFFMLFVYVAVPLIAWILGRRSGRKKTKARHTFGWVPRCGFVELVNMMAGADLKAVQAGGKRLF